MRRRSDKRISRRPPGRRSMRLLRLEMLQFERLGAASDRRWSLEGSSPFDGSTSGIDWIQAFPSEIPESSSSVKARICSRRCTARYATRSRTSSSRRDCNPRSSSRSRGSPAAAGAAATGPAAAAGPAASAVRSGISRGRRRRRRLGRWHEAATGRSGRRPVGWFQAAEEEARCGTGDGRSQRAVSMWKRQEIQEVLRGRLTSDRQSGIRCPIRWLICFRR